MEIYPLKRYAYDFYVKFIRAKAKSNNEKRILAAKIT